MKNLFKVNKLLIVVAFVLFLCPSLGLADSILGTVENFAVLAYSGITNTGATTITGNIGSHPTGSVTGQADITLTGAYHLSDAVALTAKNDLSNAYTALNNMSATETLTNSQLAGSTLKSGVYAFGGNPASVDLDGVLTLDAEFNNNAYWVFQIPNILNTGVSSSVNVINFGSNGGYDDGLFWVVGSSANLFASTSFEGNILAYANIALYNSATILNGRALAENAAVTMDTNTISNICPIGGAGNGGPGYIGGLKYDSTGAIVPIGPSHGTSTVPEPTTILLLGLGLLSISGLKRKDIL